MGIPETVKTNELNRLCSHDIPKALGIDKECTIERADCLGATQTDRRGPKQVIAKYLNYNDKAMILQTFRTNRDLQIDGNELLIFADYSIDLSKRRKAFSKTCTQLFYRQIKFSLAYPATLYVALPEGGQRTFYDHTDAEKLSKNLEHDQEGATPTGK